MAISNKKDGINKLNKYHRHWMRCLKKGDEAVIQDRYGKETTVTVLSQQKGVVQVRTSTTKLRFVKQMIKLSNTSWFTLWPLSTTPGLTGMMDFTIKILKLSQTKNT